MWCIVKVWMLGLLVPLCCSVPAFGQLDHDLVAEDDDEIRQVVATALREDGYDVIEARTGTELLDHLGSSRLLCAPSLSPDVIISDIRMAGLTGMEILAGLRDAEWHTPIVLMTAFADEYTEKEAYRLGADAFFRKPFDVDDMLTVVLNVTTAHSERSVRWR